MHNYIRVRGPERHYGPSGDQIVVVLAVVVLGFLLHNTNYCKIRKPRRPRHLCKVTQFGVLSWYYSWTTHGREKHSSGLGGCLLARHGDRHGAGSLVLNSHANNFVGVWLLSSKDNGVGSWLNKNENNGAGSWL